MNIQLKNYKDLLQNLKYLIDKNRGDTEEADFVRENLKDAWRGLSQEECDEAADYEALLGLNQFDLAV